MLAKLIQESVQSEAAQDALSFIEQHLNSEQVSKLLTEVMDVSPVELRFLDKSIVNAFETVKHTFLRQPHYFNLITYEQLVGLANEKRYHREVMIAIIRKFNLATSQKDPFARHFSYELLAQGGAEQNYLYLSRFLDQCSNLPINQLQPLAKNKAMATRMLQDMSNTQHYFSFSAMVLSVQPALSKRIAKAWQFRLQTLPLTAKEKSDVARMLPSLQKEHVAFRALKLNARALRANRFVTKSHPKPVIKSNAWWGTVKAALAAVALPSVPSHAQSILTLSTALFTGGPALTTAFSAYCATSLPVLLPLGVYTGISCMRRHYAHR